MPESAKPKLRRRWQLLRRLTLLLMRFGVTSEAVAVTGMGLGILAGIAFMATGEVSRPVAAWGIGAGLCLLRILAIRLDAMLQPVSSRQSREDEFYNELPETGLGCDHAHRFRLRGRFQPMDGARRRPFRDLLRLHPVARDLPSRRVQNTGPFLMTRTHRLVLLAAASLSVIFQLQSPWPAVTITELTLDAIVAGCLITVAHRWFLLRGIRV